jgi:integrase
MHHEIIALRHVLKTANRHGWLPYLPDISTPYKMSGKINHRTWFSPEEYKAFFRATGERAKHPKKERWRSACEDLHDYVLFMVNSGLRPDEAKRIELRDIDIVADGPGNEDILHIAVRGKRGVGYCKTMPGAVLPFKRMIARHNHVPNQLLFPKIQRELFNTLLDELDIKHDREGNPRTSYSLRHTYICFRLMGDDREILCVSHQEHARCFGNQCSSGQIASALTCAAHRIANVDQIRWHKPFLRL